MAMSTAEAGRIALACMQLVIDNSNDTQLRQVASFDHETILVAIDKIENVGTTLGIM